MDSFRDLFKHNGENFIWGKELDSAFQVVVSYIFADCECGVEQFDLKLTSLLMRD